MRQGGKVELHIDVGGPARLRREFASRDIHKLWARIKLDELAALSDPVEDDACGLGLSFPAKPGLRRADRPVGPDPAIGVRVMLKVVATHEAAGSGGTSEKEDMFDHRLSIRSSPKW
ncbi:hypothetical protein HJFPF1_01270 [Paramyrothecium foliicola]|nr:hypothetical protein HJFPF1_01270 [Paramyrothecium foliicola]